MAYTPINWQTGDTITAEKMNKMDNGWSVDSAQLFSETVTTTAGQMGNSAVLSYTGTTIPDSMSITFDGTEYTCPLQSGGGQYWYGAPNPADWSTYPFVLLYMDEQWLLVTQTAGNHTVSATEISVEISDNFSNVVNQCVDTSTLPMLCVSGTTTQADMISAMESGKLLLFNPFVANSYFITSVGADSATFIPTNDSIQISFVNGIFTVSLV